LDEIKGYIEMGLNNSFKNLTKDFLYYSGGTRLLLYIARHYNGPRLLIITYHSITSASDRDTFLGFPVDIFEEHLKVIRKNFKIVSMKEGLEALCEANPRDFYAAINFDDGYMDNYLYAYPILKKYGMPATIFLTTDFIGNRHIFWWDRVFNILSSLKSRDIDIDFGSERFYFNRDTLQDKKQAADCINRFLRQQKEDTIEYLVGRFQNQFPLEKELKPSLMLGWREIKEMDRDIISFGSHTKTHRNLCLLGDDEVREELIGSKREIERHLGTEVVGFSYPFGIFDERIKRLVREAGFKYARATLRGLNHKARDEFNLASIGGGSVLNKRFLMARLVFNFFNHR
jgi:peptidoglycan/xylan/chitin deacetylase (PgdA/CDA1 family)